jgi:hypothetical protein
MKPTPRGQCSIRAAIKVKKNSYATRIKGLTAQTSATDTEQES